VTFRTKPRVTKFTTKRNLKPAAASANVPLKAFSDPRSPIRSLPGRRFRPAQRLLCFAPLGGWFQVLASSLARG
jgi:hypothetical protein